MTTPQSAENSNSQTSDRQILSVEVVTCERVMVEGFGFWDIFYRYASDNWTVRMGESEEPVYDEKQVSALETLYQRWRADRA